MMRLRKELLSSKLENLSKNDLIDLLLLPTSEQKSENLHSIKSEIDSLNSNATINDNNLSVGSSQQTQMCNTNHNEFVEKKRVKLHENDDSQNPRGAINDNRDDNKTDSLDTIVGVYMAYSIFHGYLNLVIPRTGTTEPHLEELMQDYEATNDVQFSCYKLFLLIPKSTYCPTTLEEASKRIIKCRILQSHLPSSKIYICGNIASVAFQLSFVPVGSFVILPKITNKIQQVPLPEKLITRAGVQQRSYKNSVYKIVDTQKSTSTFVVAEYATPVKTYKDVLTYNYGEDSDVYKRNKDKVVLKFNLALQKILQEHEDCTDYCELVYYNDKNDNGSLRDLADILLERIENLKGGEVKHD